MKLLMALPHLPYPLERGDRLRAFQQLCYLNRHHEVYVVCLAKTELREEDVREVQKQCKELHIIPLPKWRRALNLSRAATSKLPYQVSYYHSPQMKACIAQLVQQHSIEVVYAQLVRMGMNIPYRLRCAYYLDYMDSFSSNFRKRVRLSKWYEKPMVQQEAQRLADYETHIAQFFQGYSIISAADRAKFEPQLADKLQIIPNGVGERFLNYQSPIANKVKKYHLLFTGNMGYHPNVQASLFLVNKILPLLEKKELNLKVCIAGSNPTPAVMALENHPAVTVTGYVEDLREYMATSRLFVAPLFSGAGLQNKLLEAMAMAMPVLTSPDTNQALGALNGHDLIECADEQAFAGHIEFLLKHEKEAERLGESGRKFVQSHYDWEAANRLLELSLLRLVEGRK